MPTPSNADYLNAINADKNPGNGNAIPSGYSLLYSSTCDATFAQNGLYANAYVNDATGQSGVDVAFSDYSGPHETDTMEYQGDGRLDRRRLADRVLQSPCEHYD